MDAARAAQLLAANEQLVLAVIQAQDEAAAAGQALREATRSAHLAGMGERPDGALLFNRLSQGMAAARRSGGRLGLLFLSIDNFQDITDAQGHAVGEQVLTLAAQRVMATVRSSDIVSRHGASDFLVLLTAVSGAGDAIAVAESAIAALGLPAVLAGVTVRLKASAGISVFPDDGDDPDALIDRATAAMYRARRGGLGSFFYRGESPTSARSLELRATEAAGAPVARQAPPGEVPGTQAAHQREAN